MLINADELEEKEISAPICIIGSGIGGGTLAKLFHETRQPFILVEAGDINGNSKVVQYDNVGLPFRLSTTTSIELGGTSNLWHGVLGMLDPIDFTKRDWIPHSGWPIQLTDLLPFYEQVGGMFGVRHSAYFSEHGLSEQLTNKLHEMPFDRSILRNKLFQQPLPSLRFKKVIQTVTKNSDDFNCLYNATALELKVNENGVVRQLLVRNRKNKAIVIESDRFILAAGALQSPRLLLNSQGFRPGERGNERGLVGKFLMDHPMGNLFQMELKKKRKAHLYSDLKYAPKNKVKSGLVFHDAVQENLQIPNHNFYLRPSFVRGINDESEKIKLALLTFLDRDKRISIQEILNVVTNFNVVMQILSYKFSLNVTYRYTDAFFVTEQVPNAHSAVTLSEKRDQFGYPIARVNWALKDEDLTSMTKVFSVLKNQAFDANAFTFVHNDKDLKWEEIFTSGAHHVGTLRMGSTAADAVVDRNLKVFGTQNLFVADGSVFTTSGNVNSGFTISALAARLADHLRNN